VAASATAEPAPAAPFAFADFSWVPGNAGAPERPLTWGPFTGEIRVDTAYHYSFANPKDDTISGSSEVFRHGEFQVTQLGFGGDFLYKGVMARLMTQFGMYSQTTPRNDASPARGQWALDNAYRYISEAYGGYHIDAMNGINIQAGIFMSYIGLWSYYNFDNWTYQPSYVSSNTPWFFNGVRAQIFTSDKLKIEPWLVNGWQSYGRFNEALGVGGQILWRPTGALSIVGNQYVGTDTLGNKDRLRVHTDDSIMVKYLDDPDGGISKRPLRLRSMRAARAAVMSTARRSTSSVSWPTTGCGSRTITSGSRWAVAPSTIRAGTSCSCRRSTARRLLLERRTSPTTPKTRSRPGTCKSPPITCPTVTSRSASSTTTARPTSPTSRAPTASRLHLAIRVHPVRW
jgi:hypothetical protein